MLNRAVCTVAVLTSIVPLTAEGQDTPTPWAEGIDYIASQLEAHPVVGLGEIHQLEGFFAFLDDLLASPHIQSTVDDVVVEFANSRFQETIDRYVVDLEPVPEEEILRALREHAESPTGPWESPVYRTVIDRIRETNATLAPGDRIRLVAADLPIDWERIQSGEDYRQLGGRSTHMGDVVVREVLDKGRTALFVVGGAHLSRQSVSPVSGEPRPNALSRIEDAHPGSSHVVNAVIGFGPRTPEVVPQISDIPNGSIVALANHFIGDLPAPSVIRATTGQPTAARRSESTRADLHDAYLWLGAEGGGKYVLARSTQYPDDDAWRELNRRSVIRFGSCLDPDTRFSGHIRPLRGSESATTEGCVF